MLRREEALGIGLRVKRRLRGLTAKAPRTRGEIFLVREE